MSDGVEEPMLYFLILGMIKGSVYALAGWGFSIILGILGIVNFSHGIFFILGGYLAVAMIKSGLAPWLSILAAAGCTGVFSLVIQRLLINQIMALSHMMVLVLTLGVAIVCRECMGLIFGHTERMLILEGFSDQTLNLFGYTFPMLDLIILLVSIVIFIIFHYLFRYTSIGLRLRIIGENTEMAKILGLNVNASYDLAMFFCGLWTGLAGAFTVFMIPLDLHQDVYWTIMSFLVVIIGGTGNLIGTFISALGIGAVLFLSSIYARGYADAVLYIFLLVILLVKPSGLFKSKMVVAERL